MESDDYHDYVIKNSQFIGKFEEMYRNCENPWPETEIELENLTCSLRTKQLVSTKKFKNIISLGSGKGFHLNWLSEDNKDLAFSGVEISETAAAYSQNKYPHLDIIVSDINNLINEALIEFDLIIVRELVWYILSDWSRLCDYLKRRHSKSHIIVELSFYDNQTYGNEYFDGPNDFISKFPFSVIEIVRHHYSQAEREGMLMIFGQI